MLHSRAVVVGGLVTAALTVSWSHLHSPLYFRTLLPFSVLCASAVLVMPSISEGAPARFVPRSPLTKKANAPRADS